MYLPVCVDFGDLAEGVFACLLTWGIGQKMYLPVCVDLGDWAEGILASLCWLGGLGRGHTCLSVMAVLEMSACPTYEIEINL